MILPFSIQINGMPTYFPEKIIAGLHEHNLIEFDPATELLAELQKVVDEKYLFNKQTTPRHKGNIKITTIRQDLTNRWHAGVMIDFFINNRMPNMFRFAPKVKCTGTQKIKIVHFTDWTAVTINDIKVLTDKEVLQLAQNDGFNSIADFFAYFNKNFKGKIIHWTDLRY